MVKIKETATQFRLLQCIRLLGDLSINISGESRVMFKQELTDSYFTHCFLTLSGDQGCVEPLGDSGCALDEMRKLLAYTVPWMYQNDERFDKYITEEFQQWMLGDVADTICTHFSIENTETVVCEYIPKKDIDPIAVITMSTLINPLVTQMHQQTENAKYLGEITNRESVGEYEYDLTVKLGRKETVMRVDLTGGFIIFGVSGIHKARYLYELTDGQMGLSPVKLHGTERGAIITDVYRSEQ